MARKRRSTMTPEERAKWIEDREETLRLVRERIAYHEAREQEEAARRARKARRWAPLRRLLGVGR
jgi:hypothetical protein